jgi:hypothetical protein
MTLPISKTRLRSIFNNMKSLNRHIKENLFDQETLNYKLGKWFERDGEGLKKFNEFIGSVKSKHFVDKAELKNFYASMVNAPKFVDFICDNTDFGDAQMDYTDSFYNIVRFCADV